MDDVLKPEEVVKIRKKLKLTRTGFGKWLGVGYRAVWAWEEGKSTITPQTSNQILLMLMLKRRGKKF